MRPPCCEDTSELTKGPWSKKEDKKLIGYINEHGHENWRELPKRAGLNRCGKSCRLRWINYLRPNIKRGDFSNEEEKLIIELHSQIGSKWSRIASRLPGRTDNDIKNYWNTSMRKKLLMKGVDPKTLQPLVNPNLLNNLSLLNLIPYPNWNNAFYSSNKQEFTPTLMPMFNQTSFDPTDYLLRYALDQTTQLQLSQCLMQIINPKPLPNLSDSSGEISLPQQEPFYNDINNMSFNAQNFDTLPKFSNPMASFDCEFQGEPTNPYYKNLDTGYFSEIETFLPNLFSVETPNTVNEVESNYISHMHSPSSNFFEDLEKFWENETI